MLTPSGVVVLGMVVPLLLIDSEPPRSSTMSLCVIGQMTGTVVGRSGLTDHRDAGADRGRVLEGATTRASALRRLADAPRRRATQPSGIPNRLGGRRESPS